MQDKAKICKVVKICPFFLPMKHLFCLKNGQSRRFNLWKCAVRGCVWKHPEWILRVFMHFMKVYVTFERFCFVFIDPFERFWTIFDPVWGYMGPFLDHFWTIFGPFLAIFDDFWLFLGKISFLRRKSNFDPKIERKKSKSFENIGEKSIFRSGNWFWTQNQKKWFFTQNRNNNRNFRNN